MTTPEEKPMLFADRLVRGLLDGSKTQTRRPVKPQPDEVLLSYYPTGLFAHELECAETGIKYGWGLEDDQRVWKCPYSISDRIWVREAWAPMPDYRPIADPSRYDGVPAFYRANNDRPMWAGTKWKPSIFMPRSCARILLEITNIRVERVQGISEADAKAEGLIQLPASGRWVLTKGAQYFGNAYRSHRECFAAAWDAHYAKSEYSWSSNPFVWVYDLKRLVP